MSTLLASGTSPIFHLVTPHHQTLGPFGIVTDVTFHPLPLFVVSVATVAYFRARGRVRRDGRVWPSWRTACFVAGMAAVAVAMLSGLDAFERSSFAIVGTQDSLLLFVAPFLLAVSAPISLAVAASPPERAERIRAAFTGRVARVVSYPLVAAVVFGASLCLFYFTSAYRVALDHRVLWQLIELELLCAGCLFAWPMAAIDPLPKAASHGVRMMWLLASVPYTSILGMSLDSGRRGLAPGMTVAELHTGGGIVWTVGGLVGLFAAIVVLAQWCELEQRSALRRDRVLDPEAAAQLAYWKANRLLAAEEAGLVPRTGAGELAVAALGPGGEGLGGTATAPVALPAGPVPVGEPAPDPPPE